MQRAVSLKITLAVVLAAAVVGGLVGIAVGYGLEGSSNASGVSPEIAALAGGGLSGDQLYRRDAPGVVVITSTPAGGGGQSVQRGSGFVIDKRGDVLTNDRVARGATHIRVGFSSGASYPGRKIGTDASTDVAVVRVDAPTSALSPLRFGDSTAVVVGEPVYAIGDARGLDRVMTSGIVSATGRDVHAPGGVTIANAIETDAPIGRSSSGGPLLDRNGRVIGVDTQIRSGSGGVGIDVAVPGNTARAVAGTLIDTGRASHALLGVVAVTIDPSAAGHVPGVPAHGVAIVRVRAGSPAAKAGLAAANRDATIAGESVPVGGDSIVAVDGKNVTTSEQLADAVIAHRPGDRVRLTLVRRGRQRVVTVRLGNAPKGEA